MTAIHMTIPEGWNEGEQHPEFIAMWRKQYGDHVPVPRAFYHNDGRTAFVGREPYGKDDWRWHISLRAGELEVDGRPPTWDEMVDTAHALRPGVPFIVGIPPRSFWMNIHPHVLHMIETRDEPLLEQWRANARGDKPT